MKKIALIGSTGSIGRQVLSVVRRHPDKFSIISLAAGNNGELFDKQVKEFKPRYATIKKIPENFDKNDYKGTEFYFGEDAFTEAIVKEADVVVVSLVGFKGIIAVTDAIQKGLNIALANKESLVVGGGLVMAEAKRKGIKIVPIDSEHSAIWQALSFDFDKPYKKIILTASGGAFRDFSEEELLTADYKQALKHPNWNMGDKITVDSATLVNKAFEVIEAKWLYNAGFKDIDVIIHRESIIHSMVEFIDNSVIAQMSYPDMELPIQIALSYPERVFSGTKSLNFKEIGKLTFSPLDEKRFPCFKAVVDCGKKGGAYPAVINGANEAAVKLFLQGKILYPDIYKALSGAIDSYKGGAADSLEDLITADRYGRDYVKNRFGD